MKLNHDNYFTIDNTYISNSKIGDYLKDPAFYRAKHIDGTVERKVTDPMIIGSAVDCLLTEGVGIFDKKYRCVDRRKKTDDDYEYQLNETMYCDVINICTKVSEQPAYKKIKNYRKQVILSNDEFWICGVLDFLSIKKDGTAKIIDLKTAIKADERSYHYKCMDFGYYRQMAMYDLLVRLNYPKVTNVEHYHLVVEKDPDGINNVYTYKLAVDRVDHEKMGILQVVKLIQEGKFDEHKARWDQAVEIGSFDLK